MELFIDICLYLHIASGMLSLIVAPIAMVVKKGGKQHRLWGKTYFWGMSLVTLTAIIIAMYRPIPFLLMLAIFSFYSIARGYRVLYQKQLASGQKVAIIDWIITAVATLFNIGLVVWGIINITPHNQVGYLGIVFGAIGIFTVAGDWKLYIKRPTDKNFWLYNHIGAMIGGYIATVSAFSAVNFHFLPGLVQWLWPTVLGVPLIVVWIRVYKKRLSKRKANEIVTVNITADTEY